MAGTIGSEQVARTLVLRTEKGLCVGRLIDDPSPAIDAASAIGAMTRVAMRDDQYIFAYAHQYGLARLWVELNESGVAVGGDVTGRAVFLRSQ